MTSGNEGSGSMRRQGSRGRGVGSSLRRRGGVRKLMASRRSPAQAETCDYTT